MRLGAPFRYPGISGSDLALGTEFIAHVSGWVRGWVKFVDNQPTQKCLGRAVDGFKVVEREELGDTDEDQWGTDDAGRPRDPWSRQSYLPLENAENGEIVVFVSSSFGGRKAIGKLCEHAANNARLGLPRIELGVTSYRHKQFGRIETPDLKVVGWTGRAEPPKPISQELNDEIPI
jgi:hypothetical protein